MTKSSKIQIHALNPEVPQRQARQLVRQGPRPLALEQRFMFDGAALTDATQTLDASAKTVDTTVATVERSTATVQDMLAPAERETGVVRAVPQAREILFIDSGVSDIDSLIAGTREGVEIVVLDAGSDPWQQMTDAIAQHQGLQAIHLVSHGSQGQVILGGRTYDDVSLQAASATLSAWQAYMTDSADILLYGCNVAAGVDGTLLIDSLARLTRADVAASTDLTGAASLGGDWQLEQSTGQIESGLFASLDKLADYQGDLAAVTLAFAAGSDTGTTGDNKTNQTAPTFSYTVATAAGSYVVTIDNVAQAAVATTATVGQAVSFSVSGLADGSHTVSFASYANSTGTGSVKDTGTYTFTVDATAPTPTVAASSITTAQSATVRSNEVGTAYLVNTSVTVTNEASITGAADASWNSVAIGTANTDTALAATGLTGGTYKVYTVDAAGNLSSASTNSVTVTAVDATAPDTSITSTPATSSNSTSATFNWSGTDNVAVTGYDYRLDGGSWTATAGTTVTLSSLTQGSHTFEVRAKDAQANVDATPASYTWTVDTTAPAAPSITTVSDNVGSVTGTVANNGVSDDTVLVLTGTAEANSTVSVYNGVTLLGTATANGSGAWSYTTSTLSDGTTYAFNAKATDVAGNTGSASANYSVTIDTSGPATTVSTLAFSADTGSVGDFVTSTSAQTLSGTLSANLSAGESVQVSLDNGSTWQNATASVGSNTFSLAGLTLAGSDTLKVRVVDAAGNAGSVRSQAYVLDATAPGTSLSTQPAAVVKTGAASFSWSGSDTVGLAGYEYRVDGGAWTATSATSVSLSALATGSHTFEVRAIDTAGNVDATPETYSWMVDPLLREPGLAAANTEFGVLLQGTPFDPVNDTQSNAADTDLVGDASNPLLLGAYDSASDVMYFRVRIGDPTMVKVGTTYVPRFTGVALIGLDVNNDGRLDLMLGVDGRNSGLGVVLYDPGTGANDRPSTTSIANQTAAWAANDLTLSYDTVNKASSTTTYRYELIKANPTDVGASDGQDAYLTFKVPFSVLVQRLATAGGGRSSAITLDTDGQPINESSAFRFALFTMTQNNSINGDVGGIGKSNTDYNKPWSEISTTLSFTKPTVLGVSGTIAYSENQGTSSTDQAGLPKALAPTATLADLDTSNFSGSSLVLGFDAASWHSGDALTVLDGANGVTLDGANLLYNGSVIGSYNWDAGAHTLTISFSASGVPADAVQAVLRSVAYRNTSENPDASTRTIAFNFTDPDGYRSAASAVTVAFTAINDAPVISQNGSLNRVMQNSVSYDDSSVAATLLSPGVDSGIVIADVDAGTRTVEARLSVDKGVLDLYDSTLVSGSVATTFAFTAGGQSYSVEVLGAGTSTLILRGNVDAINAFLAGHSQAQVVFQPGSIPGEGAQSAALTLTVHDLGNSGTGGNLSATRTVGTLTIEGTPLLLGTFKGSVREDDTAGSQLATGNTIAVASGSALGLVPASAISYQGNSLGTPALGTLTVDASGNWTYTVSNSEAAIQALASGQSIVETYKLQGTVTDAQQVSSAAIGYIEITIGGVNDAPVLAATGGSRSYTENTALGTVLFTSASAAFGAGETGQSFTGLSLTVDHVVDGDRLLVDGSLLAIDTASSGTLTTGGYTVDVALDGQGRATLTIHSSGASAAQLQGLVESLRFFSVSENPTALNSADVRDTRVVTLVSLTDSGGTSNGGADTGTPLLQATVDLTAVNDAPGGTDAVLNMVKNGTRVLGANDFGYSDPEGDAFTSVQITALESAGTLQYNSGTAQTPNWVDVSLDQVILAADLAAGKLRYQPVADASGQAYASFGFKVNDGSTPSASSNTITFNVIDNNTAPTTQDGRITANEDAPRLLDASAFYFGDVNGDVLDSIIITATGGNGSFQYRNGAGQWVAVGVEQTITAAELAAGRLRFVPQDNGYGEDYATLTFKVSDGDKTSEAATLTFDVAPVNDAPSGTDHMVNAHLGAPHTLIESDFGFSDVDGGDLLAIKFTQLGSYAKGGLQVFDTTGTGATLDGVAGNWRALVEGESVSSADIMAGRLRFGFTDTSNLANFTYTYSFQVQDDGGTANGGVDLDPVANTCSLHFDAYTPAISVPVEQAIREDGTFVFTGDTAITIAHTQAQGIPKEQLRVLVDFSATVGGTLTLASDPPAGVSRANVSEDGKSFDYVWNSDAHVVSVVLNDNGSISLRGFDDDITAALAGLTFRPVANDYSADADGTVVEGRSVSAGNHAYATVRVSATAIHVYNVAQPYDHDTGTANVDIVVKAVNDAPTLSATGGARSYTEDTTAATPLFTGVTVSTVEAGQLLNRLTLTVTGLADGERERLSVSGSELSLVQGGSGTITLPGDKLLTYSITVSGTTATVTLGRSAGLSASELQTLVESLAYRVGGDNPTGGDRVITLGSLRDNGGTVLGGQDTASLSLAATLSVLPVNDAPSARNLEVPLNLNTPYVFSTDDFGFTDTLDGNDLLAVKISTLPAAGKLQVLNDNDVWVDLQLDGGSGVSRILASDIDAGRLRYLAPASVPLAEPSFDFRTQDDGGTANGGVDTATEDHTVALNIVPLTVSSPQLNEGSDYAVFEVRGITGQEIVLALREGDTSVAGYADIAEGQTLKVWSGGAWVDYSGSVVIPAGGKLLVRVDIAAEHDNRYEGAETFGLRATNAGGVWEDGTATIKDDGTGSKYDGTITDGSPVAGNSGLDNDLALSVSAQGPVNEGSTYAFFTVDATPGQALTLVLGNTASEADRDASIGSFSFEYSTNGTSWTTYSWNGESGNRPTVPEGGKVYVRVAIASEADNSYEGAETFTLSAAIATGAGRSASATATIVDDGTGAKYGPDVVAGSPQQSGSALDDDRTLRVSSFTVNEASNYAVFRVNTTAGAQLTLALTQGPAGGGNGAAAETTDYSGTLQYFNGSTWLNYNPATPVPVPTGSTLLLVRTAVVNNDVYEGPEVFTLTATQVNGAAPLSASGQATIRDDGTGVIFNASGAEDPYAGRDDDRALQVNSLEVNEGSPYAVFTVTGTPNVNVTLSMNDGSATGGGTDYGASFKVSVDGGVSWNDYAGPVAMPSDGAMLVRTTIRNDDLREGAETFTLRAVQGGLDVTGIGTIKDDGTGKVFDADGSENTAAVKDDDFDKDGIAPNVEEILASMAASVGSGSALAGDLNGDNVADAEQNALATLAWTTVDRFNEALGGTLTDVAPIISLSVVDVATGETVSPTQQLESVKVLAPSDALIGGSKPTGADLEVLWDPIQFALTPKDPATGLADIDLTRPGTQVRVLIDISRSNMAEGSFNGYMKYVSATTLAAYGGSLTGLDGQAITTAGWYDFMQRTPGGDGARYIVEGGKITAIELIITDNRFGDNDITAGRVFDPGVPVHRTATAAARTEVPPMPGAAPAQIAPQAQREPQLAEATLPRAARPFDTALHSLQMPVAMQSLRLTEPTTDRAQPAGRGEINLEQQAWRDVYSEQSAWRTLIVEGEGERLLPFRGMTDQYARFGSQGEFSVPWDAFAHTKPDAIVLLVAKLADGSELPAWIQLGRRTGIFSYQAPAGFQGELEIELMARDTEGREATTLFKLAIGEAPARPVGRAGLSEQLRLAAQRPALWHELNRAQGGKLAVDKFPPAANRPVLNKASAG
ncbi:MAG: DUF4347 domain-containing protein [Hylemonella sp.]|nr:DUF4347 domain-containing protein [Hylemonella sp.]